MTRKHKLVVGIGIIILVLGYLIYTGFKEAIVYALTPAELMAKGQTIYGKPVRVMGMVQAGSVEWRPEVRSLKFMITDGTVAVPVVHPGAPPDLFGEGRGAVVEGALGADGLFQASTILAKHAETYQPPQAGEKPARDLYKTLIQESP